MTSQTFILQLSEKFRIVVDEPKVEIEQNTHAVGSMIDIAEYEPTNSIEMVEK
jgi:hypothetical protein